MSGRRCTNRRCQQGDVSYRGGPTLPCPTCLGTGRMPTAEQLLEAERIERLNRQALDVLYAQVDRQTVRPRIELAADVLTAVDLLRAESPDRFNKMCASINAGRVGDVVQALLVYLHAHPTAQPRKPTHP